MVILSFTFDDGNSSQIRDFYPIMRKHAFPATFYVVAGNIGLPGKLTAENLRDLAKEGNEIGSHGWTHRSLPSLGGTELRNELERSREALKGFGARTFSYPYGHYDGRVASEVALYYDAACAYGPAIVPNKAASLDRYALCSFPVEGRLQSRLDPRAPEYLLCQKDMDSNCWFIITLHGRTSIRFGIRTILSRTDRFRARAYINYIGARLSRVHDLILTHFERFCQHLARENITVLTVSEGLEQLL